MIGRGLCQSQLLGYRQSILDLLIAVIGNYGKIPARSPFAFSITIYLVSSYMEANLKAFITRTSLVHVFSWGSSIATAKYNTHTHMHTMHLNTKCKYWFT